MVFVSKGTRNAQYPADNIADYNDFVQGQALDSASLAALGTNWFVIGSTPLVDANDNISPAPAVPIYNLNGALVGSDLSDLWDGSLSNPINYDPNGDVLNGRVWTGTGISGEGISSRRLGESGYRVQYGYSSSTNGSWIDSGDWSGAGNSLHLYGISGVLTVQPVPLPGALVLLGSALALLLGYNARKNS